jgi:hypothetical protein
MITEAKSDTKKIATHYTSKQIVKQKDGSEKIETVRVKVKRRVFTKGDKSFFIVNNKMIECFIKKGVAINKVVEPIDMKPNQILYKVEFRKGKTFFCKCANVDSLKITLRQRTRESMGWGCAYVSNALTGDMVLTKNENSGAFGEW